MNTFEAGMEGRAMNAVRWFAAAALIFALTGCGAARSTVEGTPAPSPQARVAVEPKEETQPMKDKVEKSDAEWRAQLTPEQYCVLWEKGTEPAFSGKYYATKTPGVYLCVACGNELFSSETKFDSGSGWPSYWQPVAGDKVRTEQDTSHGMVRTEVLCARCGAHLGHVFDDGPKPTGLRYCINSAALNLVEKEE